MSLIKEFSQRLPSLFCVVLLVAVFGACGEEGEAEATCVGDPCVEIEDCPCSDACVVGTCTEAVSCDQTLLTWTSPVSNTDGTCLRDLGGYILHFGRDSRDYTEVIDVGTPCIEKELVDCGEGETNMQYTCSYVFTRPTEDDGMWYFAMTAYNTGEVQSDYSGEALKELSCSEDTSSARFVGQDERSSELPTSRIEGLAPPSASAIIPAPGNLSLN